MVLFSGAGYVTAATFQGFSEGINNAAFVLGAYLPAISAATASARSSAKVRTYKPSIKVKTKPAVLEATTPNADLEVSIRNAQGVADCDFTMSLNAGRRPG